MIVVWVEVSTFWHIKTEWSIVVVASEQVVWIVGDTRLHGSGLGELRRPHTHVSALCLMDSHVWWPDSVMDLSLTVVPLLEVVSTVFLMARMDLGQVHHQLLEFHLPETFIHKQIVFLMHCTMASLAGSAENFETSSKSIVEIHIKLALSNNSWL